jgi:hypothetical protein
LEETYKLGKLNTEFRVSRSTLKTIILITNTMETNPREVHAPSGQKIPFLVLNLEVQYCVHKNAQSDLILNQVNPAEALTTYSVPSDECKNNNEISFHVFGSEHY